MIPSNGDETKVVSASRLSVIIPVAAGPLALGPPGMLRAPVERAVQSILGQADPIGTEIVVVDETRDSHVADHLESVFYEAKSQGRLTVVRQGAGSDRARPSGDPSFLRNRGATVAQGSFLAFLDPEDFWKPGRLARLEPLLSRHDLILSTDDAALAEASDWILALVSRHGPSSQWAITSSGVVRRALFDEVGGFPEGYFGFPLPKKIPGLDDYEFWVRCVVALAKSDRKTRFALLPNIDVVTDPQKAAMMNAPIFKKVRSVREAVSLLKLVRTLPKKYWPELAKRVGQTGKSIFKK